MLDLVKLSKPRDRDKFLFKSLKEHLNISKEVINKLKDEIKTQVDLEKTDGLIDLQNLMKKIKAEVANQMQPAQAQELLKSIYCLLNVAGNFDQNFLENLCSSYVANTTNVEEEDLSFDPEPIQFKSTDHVPSSDNLVIKKTLANNIESLDDDTTESEMNTDINLSDETSSHPTETKPEISNESRLVNRYSDFIQKLLFPVRDALIVTLKIDTGEPIVEDIENNIASREMRIVATFLDVMVLLVSFVSPVLILIILSLILQIFGLEAIVLVFGLLPGLAVFYYYTKFELSGASTLGKQWMGLKECSNYGKPIDRKLVFVRSLLRSSPLLISSFSTIVAAFTNLPSQIYTGLSALSWLMVIASAGYYCVHKRTQGIHDLISKSIVIRCKQLPK